MILKIDFFNLIREIKFLLFKAFVAPCLASSSICLNLYSCYLLVFFFLNNFFSGHISRFNLYFFNLRLDCVYCQSAVSGFMYLYGSDVMGFTCGLLIKANLIFSIFQSYILFVIRISLYICWILLKYSSSSSFYLFCHS